MLKIKKILNRLKSLREARALLQEDVARSLGIDRTTYVRKEKGLIPISTKEWLKLAKTMEAEPEFFFDFSETVKKDCLTSCDEDALLKHYRALNIKERKEFICAIKEAVKDRHCRTAKDAP